MGRPALAADESAIALAIAVAPELCIDDEGEVDLDEDGRLVRSAELPWAVVRVQPLPGGRAERVDVRARLPKGSPSERAVDSRPRGTSVASVHVAFDGGWGPARIERPFAARAVVLEDPPASLGRPFPQLCE